MSIGDMSNFDYAVKMCRLTHGGNVPPFRCSRPPATPQAHPVPELQELLDDEELTIMPQEAEEQAEEEELRPFPFLNFQFCSKHFFYLVSIGVGFSRKFEFKL